jgi:tRNA G18 (ribose-2'-O)-methylase SpoU
MKSYRHIPLFHYDTFEEFYKALPYDARLVGVELDDRAVQISCFSHPERCVYLLGAEVHGLSEDALVKCHAIVQLPGDFSMNVAVAGSIVMFDRQQKSEVKP